MVWGDEQESSVDDTIIRAKNHDSAMKAFEIYLDTHFLKSISPPKRIEGKRAQKLSYALRFVRNTSGDFIKK